MVNTEQETLAYYYIWYYNILNIVVNTELNSNNRDTTEYYNILNIVVNTERLLAD